MNAVKVAADCFVCSQCRNQLALNSDGRLQCAACHRSFGQHAGVWDFRTFEDPYLSFDEDKKRTDIVLEAVGKYQFQQLLEYYWTFSDITPVALRPRYVSNAMRGEQRAEQMVSLIEENEKKHGKDLSGLSVVEIGSGTGNFLKAANGRFNRLVGLDIAMRWLHVGRARFDSDERNLPELVCACAESLPFPDQTFDLIVSASTLEFSQDPQLFLRECRRVLKPGGRLYLNTVNRFALGRDPYAFLPLIGFLPRHWQRYCAKAVSGCEYRINTMSLFELESMASSLFTERTYLLPQFDRQIINQLSGITKLQAQIYLAVRNLKAAQLFLRIFGPGWDAIFQKEQV